MVHREPWQQIVLFNSFWHQSPPTCERCDCELWRSPAIASVVLQGCEIQNSQRSPSLSLMLRRSYFFVFALCPFSWLISPIISYCLKLVKLEAWAFTQALWEPLFTPGCSSTSGTNRGLVKLPNCNLYRLTNNLTPDHSSNIWFNACRAPRVVRAQVWSKFRGWCVNLLHN